MTPWVEERCEMVRLALQIAGFPDPSDAERLEDWLVGCVEVRRAPVPRASIRYREDGSAVITQPTSLFGWDLEAARVEECGHYLIGSSLAAMLRSEPGGGDSLHRILRMNELREEALAREFLLAWFLPASLLRTTPPDELAELSRCPQSLIAERLRTLDRRYRPLQEPPRWSAAWEYALQIRTEPPRALLVTPHGADHPEYQFLVTRTHEEAAYRIWADLCALNLREFGLKYAYDRLRPGRPVEVPFESLLAWAGRSPSRVR